MENTVYMFKDKTFIFITSRLINKRKIHSLLTSRESFFSNNIYKYQLFSSVHCSNIKLHI